MEFKTASGSEVKINVADFITSMKLKKAVVEAVKESDADVSKIDLANLKMGAIESILQIILTADSSDKVELAIFDCLKRCTYNSEKITREVFEPIDARKDYYEIVIACLKVNLAPFFEPLFLKLNELQDKMTLKSQQQK